MLGAPVIIYMMLKKKKTRHNALVFFIRSTVTVRSLHKEVSEVLAEEGRAVLRNYIRIRSPVCRCRAVLVCHIRRTGFHRNCICRNSHRRTSTEAVKSRSNCSYLQLLSVIDYAESHFLTKKESTAILQVRNKGVFIR